MHCKVTSSFGAAETGAPSWLSGRVLGLDASLGILKGVTALQNPSVSVYVQSIPCHADSHPTTYSNGRSPLENVSGKTPTVCRPGKSPEAKFAASTA